MKSYFAYFQPNSIRKPLKQTQNIRWNYYIDMSKLHLASWTHLGTLHMLAKTQVNQVIWMKCNALPKNTCSCHPKEKKMSMHAFNLFESSNHTIMFCSCFELFVSVGFQQTMGLPSLCLFSLVIFLYTIVVYVLAQSFLFGHIKSYFPKNKVI